MKILFAATSLVLLFSVSLIGQNTVTGFVFDGYEKSPLPGANVSVKGTYQGAVTGSSGKFVIANIFSDEITLRITYVGYQPNEILVKTPFEGTLEIAMEPSPTIADEVIVVGLRADSRTPATFTNVSREELAARNLGQDIPFLLSLTPSTVASSDAGAGVGYTSFKIRGSDDTRINVTLNGVPLNDSESHGVWWVNIPDIVSSVDNMQVQRGVGLSTHGAGAFGATISLKTTGLNQEPAAFLDNSVGSFSTMKNTAGFSTGLLNNKWAFDGRLSRVVSDGYVDRASANLRSFFLSGGYFGQKTALRLVTFSGKEKTYLAWNGVPSTLLESNRTFNPSGRFFNSEGNEQFYENETDNYEQHHFQMHLFHSFNRDVNASLAVHYTKGKGYYEQYRSNDRLNRYNINPVEVGGQIFTRSDLIRRRWLDNDFVGAIYSWNYNHNQNLVLSGGGGFNTYLGSHFGEIIWARNVPSIATRHRYYDNNASKNDFNTFVKANVEISTRLSIFADLQYRYVRYSFEGPAWVLGEVTTLDHTVNYNFFNPKVGFTYKPMSSAMIHFFAGIGNREPVRRDFTESSPESRPRQEKMQNLELGYRQGWKRLQLAANLYYMNYKDQLILTGQINDVGGFTRKNIDKSYRTGVELELGYKLSEKLLIEANTTFSQNKINLFVEHNDLYDANYSWIGSQTIEYSKTNIALSPSLVSAGSLTYSPLNNLSLNLTGKYVGKQYIDNTSSNNRALKAYFVNDFRINYTLKPKFMKEFGLTFQINNLFNVLYETNAWVYKGVVEGKGLITLDDGFFPQAGRHFYLGTSLKF